MNPPETSPLSTHNKLSEIQGYESHWYVTDDGTKLFYEVDQASAGADAGIPFILCDGLGCDGYVWKYMRSHFGKNHPMIHINYRGHGQSDIPTDITSVSIEKSVKDLQGILAELGLEQALFCGHSMGVQIALEYLRQQPAQVAGLLLLCGSYEFPIHTWHAAKDPSFPIPLSNRVMQKAFPVISNSMVHFSRFLNPAWKRLMATDLSFLISTRLELNADRVKKEDFMPYLKHLASMDTRVFGQMAKSVAEHSAATLLESIEIPTLVVAGGQDTFTPAWLSQQMHWRIRGSEYLFISDGSHTTPIEHPKLLNIRLEKFLNKYFNKELSE
jgi:pimeloyl-ACP methyl ester carboxylesterase